MNQPAQQDSVLQFGLRAMLFLTIGPAIVCAALAPRVREWDSRHMTHLGVYLLLNALVWVGTIALLCWQRYRAERLCGKLLLRIQCKLEWLFLFYAACGTLIVGSA